MTIVGLDLGGVETRPSGFCVLRGMQAKTCVVYTDAAILAKIQGASPKVVAIDAPLSLPPGRQSIEQKTANHLRECDKELIQRGIRFFPITLGPMRKLATRGINLRLRLEGRNFKVIEVYPGGAQDVLSIPRKQQGLDKLRTSLEHLGMRGLNGRMSDHELDAVTCAFVGKIFVEGKSVTYGTPERGIVMPPGEKRWILRD